jgi:hypothetical protein
LARVCQHASDLLPPPSTSYLQTVWVLLKVGTAGQAPEILANCLNRATSMTLDQRTDRLYITELTGRVIAIALSQ